MLATRRADERWEDVKLARTLMGGVLGPFESWLLLRGMRTLHVRYERQAENAMAIARHFDGHPKLDAVLYPGLESHPGHAVAKRQMTNGFGAMLSLLVAGDAGDAKRVATRTRLFVAGDLAGRRGEPDRAPCHGGGAAQRGAGEPAPRLGRHRKRG